MFKKKCKKSSFGVNLEKDGEKETLTHLMEEEELLPPISNFHKNNNSKKKNPFIFSNFHQPRAVIEENQFKFLLEEKIDEENTISEMNGEQLGIYNGDDECNEYEIDTTGNPSHIFHVNPSGVDTVYLTNQDSMRLEMKGNITQNQHEKHEIDKKSFEDIELNEEDLEFEERIIRQNVKECNIFFYLSYNELASKYLEFQKSALNIKKQENFIEDIQKYSLIKTQSLVEKQLSEATELKRDLQNRQENIISELGSFQKKEASVIEKQSQLNHLSKIIESEADFWLELDDFCIEKLKILENSRTELHTLFLQLEVHKSTKRSSILSSIANSQFGFPAEELSQQIENYASLFSVDLQTSEMYDLTVNVIINLLLEDIDQEFISIDKMIVSVAQIVDVLSNEEINKICNTIGKVAHIFYSCELLKNNIFSNERRSFFCTSSLLLLDEGVALELQEKTKNFPENMFRRIRSKMVQYALIPLLEEHINHVWDPLNRNETKHLFKILDEFINITYHLGPEECKLIALEKIKKLLNFIILKVNKCSLELEKKTENWASPSSNVNRIILFLLLARNTGIFVGMIPINRLADTIFQGIILSKMSAFNYNKEEIQNLLKQVLPEELFTQEKAAASLNEFLKNFS